MENLDTMTEEQLMDFWKRYCGGTHYRELFPDGGEGTKKATADLANYASNRATVIACRQRGAVETALQYEGICDRIYRRLPAFARW